MAFADARLADGVSYVWIAERGLYRPMGSRDEAEAWFYFWWSKAAVVGNSGQLADKGLGVRAGSGNWRVIQYRISN
jgi:hypothetical protein